MAEPATAPDDESADTVADRIDSLLQETISLVTPYLDGERSLEALTEIAARWRSAVVPVAVVGEVSRGKSTLINALLGTRLLPSDFSATTVAWTRLSWGEIELAAAKILAPDATVYEQRFTREDFGVYLSAEQQPRFAARHDAEAQVLAVSVELPAPLLRGGLQLIDTPGVGGRWATHRQAALAGLARADALLFTIAPGEPVSVSERRFLAEALSQVQTCVLVQTRKDLTDQPDERLRKDWEKLVDVREWRKILGDAERAAEVSAILARSPAVSVSAVNALKGLEAAAQAEDAGGQGRGPLAKGPSSSTAQALWATSGIEELRDLLTNTVARHAQDLHRANVLRLASLALDGAVARAQDRVKLLKGGDERREAQQEYLRRVIAWLDGNGPEWKADLQLAGQELHQEIAEMGREISIRVQQDYSAAIDRLRKPTEFQSKTEELTAELDAAFQLMLEGISVRLTQETDRVRRLMGEHGLDGPLSRLDQARRASSRLPDTDADGLPPNSEDLRQAATGAMVGGGIGHAILGVFDPLTAALGAVTYFVSSLNRQERAENRTMALRTLASVRNQITAELVPEAQRFAREAREAAEREIDATLGDVRRVMERDAQALREADSLSDAEAVQRIADHLRTQRQAAALRQQLEALR